MEANVYGLRANERTIPVTELDGSNSGALIVVNIDIFEIVGKISPPLMEPVYKEGYNG